MGGGLDFWCGEVVALGVFERKVQHKVRFAEFDFPHGEISFSMLSKLAEKLTRLGECVLLSAVEGNSALHRGRPPRWLSESVDFSLTGIEKGSTVLAVEAPVLSDTLDIDRLLLIPEKLRDGSAIDAGMEAMRSVSAGNGLAGQSKVGNEWEGVDKNLLNELYSFQQLLGKGEGRIEFSSLGNFGFGEAVVLNQRTFERIKELKDAIPSHKQVLLKGTFDALRSSSGLLEFIIDGRRVRARLSGRQKVEAVRDLLNEEVTINGIAHYGMNGLLTGIEVERMHKTTAFDSNYFAILSDSISEKTDLDLLRKKQGVQRTKADDLIGKWPGDESIDDLLRQLDS
jgi:hypothetical protein